MNTRQKALRTGAIFIAVLIVAGLLTVVLAAPVASLYGI